MKQYTIVSLATYNEFIAEAHRADCADLAKKVAGNVPMNVSAENVREAVEQYISGELEEMGYYTSDVKVLGCAR